MTPLSGSRVKLFATPTDPYPTSLLPFSFYPTLAIPSQTHLYPSLPISPYPSPQAYRTTSPKWLRLLGVPGRGYCRNTPETTETVLVGS